MGRGRGIPGSRLGPGGSGVKWGDTGDDGDDWAPEIPKKCSDSTRPSLSGNEA